MSELGGDDAVGGDGGAAADDVSERDGAGFDVGAAFDVDGELLADASQADGVGAGGVDLVDDLLAASGLGAFGDADEAEAPAVLGAFFDEVVDDIEVVVDLGKEDDIRARCDTGVEGDPAGVSSHDLDDHDAMVAHRGGVEAVDGFGGGLDGGGETEGDVGADEIIVDGLGDADEVDAVLNEVVGAGHGAVTADDNDGVEFVAGDGVEALLRAVLEDGLAVGAISDGESRGVGFVGGAEDGAAKGEDAGDIAKVEWSELVFDEPEEAVLDAEDLPAVIEDGGLGDGSDDGVEAGAIASSCQDADAFGRRGHRGSIGQWSMY